MRATYSSRIPFFGRLGVIMEHIVPNALVRGASVAIVEMFPKAVRNLLVRC